MRGCSEARAPCPLVWARRCTLSACSTGRGQRCGSSEQQCSDPARGRALRQEPLLDSDVDSSRRRDVEGQADGVLGQVGILRQGIVELADEERRSG